MARQRMVKPDFFDSESLAMCSFAARIAFIGLWCFSDDRGNAKASVRKLRKQIFPNEDMRDAEFEGLLSELEEVGCIKEYEVDGERYITVPNFLTYQTVKNPSKTNIPAPPKSMEKVKITHFFQPYCGGASPVQDQRAHGMAQPYPSAGLGLAQDGRRTGADPGLAHGRPPMNELKKGLDILPTAKISNPPPNRFSELPIVENSADGKPICPRCRVPVWKDNQTGRFHCDRCGETYQKRR